MTQGSYFTSLSDGRFMPTEHSGGAWRDDELHLAPVAGLVVHEMERWREANTDGSLVFSRFSFEVLGQIGREAIELSTELLRSGRTIQLIETTAVIAGRVIIRARGWMLQASDTAEVEGHEFDEMPPLSECDEDAWLLQWPGGFIRTLRAKQDSGGRPGRVRVWVTSEMPLIAGVTSSPLANFAKMLDTANGVAVRQSPSEWMFPNVDLTLHLFRQPSGDTMGVDTRANFGAGGIGLTSSTLHDALGPVGTIQQSLTLRRLMPRDEVHSSAP